ncbi:DUF350 domain-containing protein [Marinirhabdus gelatinilytica]|uniref:Uncharacterized protein DUF350 n=1 Tax=Marinirhabdus gelatinilytica TaxID=1703343 RepID=A0A370QKJ0_9FLAO|nr:DUF350 domain-containing protein [Marinirhabdus gelatinilytica]RDK88841.1 uncharacterized protein DUF350 [Marinirhabdus gelatinilytica]
MNSQLFIIALIEIILSLVVSVLIIFTSYIILKRLFFKTEDVQGNNMAFTVFTSGIIFSIGLILSEIVPSITNVIRIATTQEETISLSTVVSYSSLYLFIGFVMAVFINAAVFFLFSILTRGVNEFKAIKTNNLSVAILVVSILISITLIAKDSIELLISALVPYPEVSNFL